MGKNGKKDGTGTWNRQPQSISKLYYQLRVLIVRNTNLFRKLDTRGRSSHCLHLDQLRNLSMQQLEHSAPAPALGRHGSQNRGHNYTIWIHITQTYTKIGNLRTGNMMINRGPLGGPNCEITSIPNGNPNKSKLIQAATLRVVHTKARQTLGCLATCSVRTPKRSEKTSHDMGSNHRTNPSNPINMDE